MGTIVVDYKMEVNAGGGLCINLLEKLQELVLAMFRHTGPDYFPVKDIERGKEGCCAVSLVIMSHGAGMTLTRYDPS
jgi:hypothetical protein